MRIILEDMLLIELLLSLNTVNIHVHIYHLVDLAEGHACLDGLVLETLSRDERLCLLQLLVELILCRVLLWLWLLFWLGPYLLLSLLFFWQRKRLFFFLSLHLR
jgi:hypothetical protein